MPPPEHAPRRRKHAGSIYAIGAAESPYIKIGSTQTTVEQRLRTLQTGQPARLHIVAAHTVESDLLRIERQIHTFLAAERHHGEWFALMLDAEALHALIVRAVDYLAEADRTAATLLEQQAQRPTKPRGKLKGPKPLANRLAEHRKARHLTRLALGAVFNVDAVTIWRWETQINNIAVETLIKLAHFFQVPPSDLIPALASGHPSAPRAEPSKHPPHKTTPTSPSPQLAWEW